MISELDSNLFRSAIASGYANLENRKQSVNNLNVFPVPDGDTGTNMALTIQYAVREMERTPSSNISETAILCSNGALMGARGNSGVILSQLFRGISKSCKGKTVLDAAGVAGALQSASDMAYKAVMKPTEGTILTVAREMAEFAVAHVSEYKDIESFLSSVIERGYESLKNTPNLLQVLKDAGVVDAGGQGLLFIFEGFLAALSGAPVALKENVDIVESSEFGMNINSEITYTYCTEFLIKTHDKQEYEKMLIDRLIKLGDSLVVVQDENIVKVHVHTNEPWTAMKFAAGIGDLTKIKIENMREQHSEIFQKEESKLPKQPQYSPEEADYILISVSSGAGLGNILKDLGVTYIIEGGQTMNPSTQDFLDVISNTNGKHYILFPNNKNIILAAEQAKKISDKDIHVLPTKTIPEAISALMNFNPASMPEENMEEMTSAMETVQTGQITFAVRDSNMNGIDIKKNDVIGILGGEIEVSEKNVEKAVEKLVEKMISDSTELLTLYYGEEVSRDDAERMQQVIQGKYPKVDVELFEGNQPLYYYIISAE